MADVAKKDDVKSVVAHRCGSTVVVVVASEKVSQVVCDLELETSTRAGTPVMEDWSMIAASPVSISSWVAGRLGTLLPAIETLTLAARWDWMNSGMTREMACDRYGKDDHDTGESGTDIWLEVRDVDSVFGVDCCFRARPAKLLSQED